MQAIEIDFFRNQDAPGVARLFQQVYGEGYPVKTYYSPDQLIAENAARRIISTVARTPEGEVVGHDALILLDPNTRIYENAAGVVLPDFRGGGIFFRLMNHTIFNAAKRFGIEEILGEPVCNHTQLQKMCMRLGYKESGLEVDLMPAAAYSKEQSARGRVSVLLGYFLHKPLPRGVYLPPFYREELVYLYSDLDIERSFIEAVSDLPAEKGCKGKMDVFDFAQVARITIDCIGYDFDEFISQLESEAINKGTEVFQVWLPLTSPFVTAATEVLRMHDFFIGGLLPGRSGGDGLLMQKVKGDTDWGSIALYSERAKRIAEIVRKDQKRTTK
jgi:hypothetical protein